MSESEFELVEGSGNVFRDLGDPEADLKQAKAVLAARIIATLDERELSVRKAAASTRRRLIFALHEINAEREAMLPQAAIEWPNAVSMIEHDRWRAAIRDKPEEFAPHVHDDPQGSAQRLLALGASRRWATHKAHRRSQSPMMLLPGRVDGESRPAADLLKERPPTG